MSETEDHIWREEEGKSVFCPKFYASKTKVQKEYTMAEVAKHNTADDLWIIVEGKVYNITRYAVHHPGGSKPLLAMAGKDSTDAFLNYHPARVYKNLLPSYYIGEVSDYREAPFVKEHRAIRQQLLQEGLFETRMPYYYKLAAWLTLVFASAIGFTLYGPSMAWRLVGAVLMALFWQQLAFVGHDVGHNGVTHKRDIDSRTGLIVGNLLTGISMAWWKHTHNVHHVACNSVDIDPDIQHLPLIAVCKDMLQWWRGAFDPSPALDSFARCMVRYQHIFFYPIMSVARFNLYAQSWILLLTYPEKLYYRRWEYATLLMFAGWYSLLVSTLPSMGEMIAFVLLNHALAGVLHVQIVLSHFAMPTYRGQAYNSDEDEWFTMQVRTSLNIDTPWYLDWFHGGLQYQVEHHLWPRLPRHNLRYASTIVRAYCERHGLPYSTMGWISAQKDLILNLKKVSDEIRKEPPRSAPGFFDSYLWEGMVARG